MSQDILQVGQAAAPSTIYTDREGRPKACELEALRCDGVRIKDIDNKAHRWQRTFGDKGGSLFRLSRPRAVELVVVKDTPWQPGGCFRTPVWRPLGGNPNLLLLTRQNCLPIP